MAAYLDRSETRTPASREAALFKELRALLGIAKARAPALRQQLHGVNLADLKNREALARIPVTRKSDLVGLQKRDPPFGGFVATRLGALKRLLVSPGPIFEPEGHARNWWGAARGFHAAGMRKGDIILNCFSYHLTPGGHVMESAAHALGCAVIPGGIGNTEQQVEAIEALRPSGYCGTPDFLKIILDKAVEMGRDASSIKRAFVSGAALPASLRAELKARGVSVYQGYATADLGLIAYETDGPDGAINSGMVVNEGLILEITRPGSGDPVKPGEVGEIVCTRLNPDYPLLRFATGDLTAAMPEPSPCGRTNLRIRGWLGRADQTTKVKGMFIHPSQVIDVARRHPEAGKAQLVITRANEQDQMALRVEVDARHLEDEPLRNAMAASLQAVTKLKGKVEFAPKGALANDGKVIADERPVA